MRAHCTVHKMDAFHLRRLCILRFVHSGRAYVSWALQVELDARELTFITSKSTMAIGDNCPNLTRYMYKNIFFLVGKAWGVAQGRGVVRKRGVVQRSGAQRGTRYREVVEHRGGMVDIRMWY